MKSYIIKYNKKYKLQKRNKGALASQKANIINNPLALHQLIKDDTEFWLETNIPDKGIYSRTYIPYTRKDIPPKASELISCIARYFNCIIIWDRNILPGTTTVLRTITVYGYRLSLDLCFSWVSKTLASLDYLQINIQNRARKKRRKLNRRGVLISGMNAVQKGIRYYDDCLERTTNNWKANLREVKPQLDRVHEIYKYVDKVRKLDFRKYQYQTAPTMFNAIATPFRYQYKRILWQEVI